MEEKEEGEKVLGRITDPLFTQKYTSVFGGNISNADVSAFHDFIVSNGSGMLRQQIHFQQGPVRETGVNGVMNEDLLLMVLVRLRQFQDGPFACRENALAITKIEEAVMWLRNRTGRREAEGKEGTHKV